MAEALREGEELCVCDLSWIVGRSQNLVSHHLGALRSRGLVRSRKDGKMVMYSLTPVGRSLLGVVVGEPVGELGVKEKKMLPVFGQAPLEPETTHEETGACSDACCSENAADAGTAAPHTPRAREANPQAHGGRFLDGDLARTVVRVEGMDCASCAATVEKRVGRLPGMHRAVVNFAAGRLDAEHDPGLWTLQEIEKAVRDAGYGVGSTKEAEMTPFWRTPQGGLASRLCPAVRRSAWRWVCAGSPEVARVGAYLAAIAVGGVPIFRAALAGLRARHLDMNVLMSAATVGAVGIGQWAEAASVVVLFAAGNALQVYAIDRTRGAVRGARAARPRRGARQARRRGEGWCRRARSPSGRRSSSGPGSGSRVDGEVLEGRTTVDESPGDGRERPRWRRDRATPSTPAASTAPAALLVRAPAGGRRLHPAADHASRGGCAGQEGPCRAVRGPLLAPLHPARGGRGCRAGGRAAASGRAVRRPGSTGRSRS